MKNRLFGILLILCFGLMLFFPSQVFDGASEGLLLWFEIILPTLLPFMVVTSLLVQTDVMFYISKLLSPVLSPLLGTSKAGCFAVLAGFLCGYPMGAKVTGELIAAGRISRPEAQYLLSFCNNTSPMFIISFVVLKNLNNQSLVMPTLLIAMGTPLLLSFLFRFFYRYHCNKLMECEQVRAAIRFDFKMLDTSLINSFEAITKIGGYIILFSIALNMLRMVAFDHLIWDNMILPVIEITNGTLILCQADLPLSIRYPLLMFLIGSGGICSIAQTKCMIKDLPLSINSYIIQKLITAGVTSFIAYCYIQYFH